MNNVLIVDDHQIVHEGLKNILKNNFLVKNIFSAFNGYEADVFLKKELLDLVFLDISMPNSDVFTTINHIKNNNRQAKIIVFSMLDGKTYALRTIKAGADGYIEKNQEKTEIIAAISKVIAGKKYMSDEVLYSNIEVLNSGKNPLALLSNQELIVLKHLVKGNTNSTIANMMNLNSSTISTIKRRILDKLNANSVIEMAEIYEANI